MIPIPVIPQVPILTSNGNGIDISVQGGVLSASLDISASPSLPTNLTTGTIPVFDPVSGNVYAYPLATILGLIASAASGADAPENYTAGGVVSGDTPVMFSAAGFVIAADPTAANYVYAGIALGGAQPGSPVQAQTHGDITSTTWSWTAERPVFVGIGALTQVPPTTGRSHLIGWATGPTSIHLDPEEPITII